MDQPKPHGLHLKPQCLSTETYGLCLIGVSALLYSVMGAFVKLATQSGLPSTEIVFTRAAFQGSLVTIASLFFREASQDGIVIPKLIFRVPLGNANIRHIVIARGACGGCGFLLYYYSISALPLGDAVALLSLSPVVTVWASATFANQSIRPLHALAAITTVIGSFLIAKPDFLFGEPQMAKAPHSSLGYVTALLGTCTGAGVFLLMRKAGKVGAHTLQLLFSWVMFGLIFSSLLGMVLPAILGNWSWALPNSPAVWGFLLGCSCFGTVAHFLLNFAARHSNPGLASIVRSSGILWAYLLQIKIFGQVPTPLTCVGVVFVGMSLVLVGYQKWLDSRIEAGLLEVTANDEERSSLTTHDLPKQYGSA